MRASLRLRKSGPWRVPGRPRSVGLVAPKGFPDRCRIHAGHPRAAESAMRRLDVRRAVGVEGRGVLEIRHDVELRLQRRAERLGVSKTTTTQRRSPHARDARSRERRSASRWVGIAAERPLPARVRVGARASRARAARASHRRRARDLVEKWSEPSPLSHPPPRRERNASVEMSAWIRRRMLGV